MIQKKCVGTSKFSHSFIQTQIRTQSCSPFITSVDDTCIYINDPGTWGKASCTDRNSSACHFVPMRFSEISSFRCSFFFVQRGESGFDDRTSVLSCVATGRVKWTERQCRAGRGWEALSHYERVSAQCGALLKKYTTWEPHVRHRVFMLVPG